MTEARSTRRELVLGGLAAGAALCIAGAVGPAAALADEALPRESEPEALANALAVEELLSFVYRRALASGTLKPRVSREMPLLLAQEQEHIAFLKHELTRIGATIPAGPGDLAAAERELGRHHLSGQLADLHTQHDYLRLLVDTESVAEHAYFVALSNLTDRALLRTATEIMGCEAQHWTLLSSWQHHSDVEMSVPYPFVAGSS